MTLMTFALAPFVRSWSPTRTESCWGLTFTVQCPAVTIRSGLIREAPQ